jgi:hypothetical protein
MEKDVDQTAFLRFQDWLEAWQFNCANTRIFAKPAASTAFPASYHGAFEIFMSSLEMQSIYRPSSGRWLNLNPFSWADPDVEKCSLKIRSVDCYMQPVSHCGIDGNFPVAPAVQSKRSQILKEIQFPSQDMCGIAKYFKKPMLWLYGSLLSYIYRPGPLIQQPIYDRILTVFNHEIDRLKIPNPVTTYVPTYTEFQQALFSKDKDYSILGIFITAGSSTVNFYRASTDVGVDPVKHSFTIDRLFYPWETVDQAAKLLASQGKPLKYVYFATDSTERDLMSITYLTEKYPRDWQYIILPRESLMPNNTMLQTIQYLADIEIMSMVDFYVSSWSFIYETVQGMRIARGLVNANNSCLVDNREVQIIEKPEFRIDFPVYCGNDPGFTEIWKSRGFTGPNLFPSSA